MINPFVGLGLGAYLKIAGAILILVLLVVIYTTGRSHGGASVQQKWDAEKVQYAAEVAKQKDVIAGLQEKQRQEDVAQAQEDSKRAQEFAKQRADLERANAYNRNRIENLTRALDQYKNPVCVLDDETYKSIKGRLK